MADIYIIYAKEDKQFARKLRSHLSEQWSTWWDEDIVGEFPRVIERELKMAGCVISVISESSREKKKVLDEMRMAEDFDREIIPIKIDNAILPYPYGQLSHVEMHDWCGGGDHSGAKLLKKKIASIVKPREAPKRPKSIANNRVPLPTLFLSVSSFNTQLQPIDAIRLLRALKFPTILVSAYDLAKRKPYKLIKELDKYKEEGGFILMDSGNYEKDRLDDKSWDINEFRKVLKSCPYDWAFCYDKISSPKDKEKAIANFIFSVTREKNLSNIIPIIHAPGLKIGSGGYKLDDLPEVIRRISEDITPSLIAIPERELGAGLLARAKTIKSIRKELDKLPYYQPIHILGTGNPWAVAVFAAAGADTFDGLEWCRYIIDEPSETINHFQLMELYEFINESGMGYSADVAFKNIQYFTSFRNTMLDHYSHGKVESHVHAVLGKKAFNYLNTQYPELFE